MEAESKRKRIEAIVRRARKKMEREEKKQEEARRMKEVMRAERKRRIESESLSLLSQDHRSSDKWVDESVTLETLGEKNTRWDNMREKLVWVSRTDVNIVVVVVG